MAGPFIFVGTYAIKQGKLDEARKRMAELVEFVEENEPRMIAFHVFLDEEETRIAIVHVHPDTASMEFHMQVNARHFTTAFDYLESVVSEQYYGPISDSLDAELTKWFDPNRAMTLMPVHQGGFTRSNVQ